VAGVRGRSGGKRRNAGRPRLSLEVHRLRGTLRADRHGLVGATATGPEVVPVVMEPGEAPDHLRPETRDWYTRVRSTWVLDEHHQRLLQLACETWDAAQRAREAIARDGVTVATADGRIKAHPLLVEARSARQQFAGLLAQLELDDVGTPGGRHG
jgi:P27 family predicted phage terminase small subunit